MEERGALGIEMLRDGERWGVETERIKTDRGHLSSCDCHNGEEGEEEITLKRYRRRVDTKAAPEKKIQTGIDQRAV